MVTEAVISDSEIDSTPLSSILEDAQLAASMNDYVSLAHDLKILRSKLYFNAQNLIDAIPLAEKLGRSMKHFGHDESTGSQEALYFLQYAAKKLTNKPDKQKALDGWGRVLDGLMGHNAYIALDEITDVFVSDKNACKEIRDIAADKVSPVLQTNDYALRAENPSYGFTNLLAKASSYLFEGRYVEQAAVLAEEWAKAAIIQSSTDHLATILHAEEVAPRAGNNSPFEKVWADFILINHKKTCQLDAALAKNILETLQIHATPRGSFAKEAEKKLRTIPVASDEAAEEFVQRGHINHSRRRVGHDFV